MTQKSTSPAIVHGETFEHTIPYSFGIRVMMTPLMIDGQTVGYIVNGSVYDPCRRCGGSGHYSFDGDSTICYGCHGEAHGPSTTEDDIVRRYVARQKAAERRERQAREAAEKQAAELAEWASVYPEIAEQLVAHRSPVSDDGYADFSFVPRDRFLTSLADQAAYRPLSEKQTIAAGTALARLAERDQARHTAKAATVAAGHWGTVGKRDTVVVTVEKIIVIDGEWGPSFLCIMKSAEGHSLKCFASGGSAFATDAIEAEKDGEPMKIKATVKKHDSYKDQPQTIVTRCTVLPG